MKLTPCPYCEGPPCPIVVRILNGGGCFPDSEMDCDDGVYARAYVFCHECGAQGPAVDDNVYTPAECDSLEAQAVALWQKRTAKNRNLYDGGDANGLNEYPRSDELELRKARRAAKPSGSQNAEFSPRPDLFDLMFGVGLIIVVLIVFVLFLNTMARDFAGAVLQQFCPCRVMR